VQRDAAAVRAAEQTDVCGIGVRLRERDREHAQHVVDLAEADLDCTARRVLAAIRRFEHDLALLRERIAVETGCRVGRRARRVQQDRGERAPHRDRPHHAAGERDRGEGLEAIGQRHQQRQRSGAAEAGQRPEDEADAQGNAQRVQKRTGLVRTDVAPGDPPGQGNRSLKSQPGRTTRRSTRPRDRDRSATGMSTRPC